jgi:hypothetical protein
VKRGELAVLRAEHELLLRYLRLAKLTWDAILTGDPQAVAQAMARTMSSFSKLEQAKLFDLAQGAVLQ